MERKVSMSQEVSAAAVAEPEVSSSLVKTLSIVFGALLLAGVGVGLAGFVVGHEHIFNNTREVPWGLLISTYAFFAITSTGLCLLAAISHVFGGNKLAPLANRMVWVTLITILSGFTVIGMEIESPWLSPKLLMPYTMPKLTALAFLRISSVTSSNRT